MTQRILTVTVLVVALVAIWRYWPSDERRIQQLVQAMATALEPVAGESDLARVARFGPLARGLAPDVVIEGATPARGRDQVIAAVLQAGRLSPHLSVVLRDVDVRVGSERTTASALVTAEVSGVAADSLGGWDDITELELTLTRRDDVWLVTRVAPIVALRP